MKILYVTQAIEDYLSDSIFHGLISLGIEVVDYNRLWYMWKGNVTTEQKLKLYGRGFTLYGNLEGTDSHIDRSDIEAKVSNRYFDLVIYGSIWRCLDLWEQVNKSYNKDEIILLDGEDYIDIHTTSDWYPYFKRELTQEWPGTFPISFSIPKNKYRIYQPGSLIKTKTIATVIPGDQSTYIFSSEEDYYNDYTSSLYGITHKKSGWDSLRHYEIIAADCLPLFKIDECPELTLHNYPKDLITTVFRLAKGDQKIPTVIDGNTYNKLLYDITEYSRKYLTTEVSAKYVIDKVKPSSKLIIQMNPLKLQEIKKYQVAVIWGYDRPEVPWSCHQMFYETALKEYPMITVHRYYWANFLDMPTNYDLYFFVDFVPDLFKVHSTRFHPRVFVWMDAFHHSFAYPAQVVDCFDMSYFTEYQTVRCLNSMGITKVKWLPAAYYQNVYYPIPYSNKVHSWAFIGQPDNVVAHQGLTRKEFIEKLACEPGLSGYVGQGIYGEQINQVYNESKVLIDRCIFNNLGTRIFEIIGSGGFALVGRSKFDNGIDQIAIDGQHYISYNNSYGDCLDELKYYLDHEDERKRIAKNGESYFKKHHTYMHRLSVILNDLGMN